MPPPSLKTGKELKVRVGRDGWGRRAVSGNGEGLILVPGEKGLKDKGQTEKPIEKLAQPVEAKKNPQRPEGLNPSYKKGGEREVGLSVGSGGGGDGKSFTNKQVSQVGETNWVGGGC